MDKEEKKTIRNIYLFCPIMCEICNKTVVRASFSIHRKRKGHIKLAEKYHGGMICDPEEFNRLRSILYGRKGY